jgi:hypothetical protein
MESGFAVPQRPGFKIGAHFLLSLPLIRQASRRANTTLAKDLDHLAGSFDTDNTGGLLSGFLAEEDEFDRPALWRLGTWGVASVAAVVVAVMANQSSLGWRREQIAAVDLVQQANRLQDVAKETQNEVRRLASSIDTLNGDRDRLYSRVTVLEQGLDTVTGAIARQDPAAAAPSAEAVPAPVMGPVATTQAAPAEKAPATSEQGPTNVSSIARNAPNKNADKKPAVTPATPPVESKSTMAPLDPAANKSIEPDAPASVVAARPIPEVAASAPSAEDVDADAESVPKIQRTEFGVDVGGANSVAGLRALWRRLLKSRANAPLAALRPIIVIKEGSGGFGMQLRLVAGPLRDAAAAAKICAVLTENQRACDTTVFDGQRLSMNTEKVPAAVKPAPSRKQSAAKRATFEEPPKKPETSTLPSFFGKKSGQ